MTSKEIVRKTLEFARPERLARSFPEPWGSDLCGVGADIGDPKRYEKAAATVAADKEHFMLGDLPGFVFSIGRKIRLLDQYLMDLHLHRDKIEILHERIFRLVLAIMENYRRIGARPEWQDWACDEYAKAGVQKI